MNPYYYTALCIIKQTGANEDPDVKRELCTIETIQPPTQSVQEAREHHHSLVALFVEMQRVFNTLTRKG